jgi:hypothetical protein
VPKKKYTPESIIDLIQDFYNQNGKPPTFDALGVSIGCVRRYFGTWRSAIESAGLQPSKSKPRLAADIPIGRTRDGWRNDLKVITQTILNGPFDQLGWDKKRIRVIKEQDHYCAHCKLDTWQTKPIPLEIDHIDGNRHNHTRENLEAICPNCHALTITWRGRNKSSNRLLISDEVLIAAINNTSSIRQALIQVNLAPKGGNYKRAVRLKQLYCE